MLDRHRRRPDEHHIYAGAPGLKAAREALGVALEDLAGRTGYPVAALRDLEGGQLVPRMVTSKISAVLGVETDRVRGR